jgi:ABC-type uncharacterized transport system permease subunit
VDLTAALFVATVGCYALAGAFFFAHLARGSKRSATLATGVDLVGAGHPPLTGIHQTLAVLSFLVALGYLASMRRRRLTVLGAFITPVTLLLLLGAGLRGHVTEVPEHVRSAMLPLHIVVNVLGIVAFALAFAVAVAYVIQEQLLRRKQLGGVFQRLPALDVLDELGLRLVTIGFPLFTIGVVTGSIWAAQLGRGNAHLSAGQGFAVLAWLFFASVLLARAAAGWRGRRAAVGTMLGFLCALAAIGGYLLQSAGGG